MRYTDALTMADQAMTYRYLVNEVAHANVGRDVHAEADLERERQGMHMHQSIFEGDRNAFFEDSHQYHLSRLARVHRGRLRHAPE